MLLRSDGRTANDGAQQRLDGGKSDSDNVRFLSALTEFL